MLIPLLVGTTQVTAVIYELAKKTLTSPAAIEEEQAGTASDVTQCPLVARLVVTHASSVDNLSMSRTLRVTSNPCPAWIAKTRSRIHGCLDPINAGISACRTHPRSSTVCALGRVKCRVTVPAVITVRHTRAVRDVTAETGPSSVTSAFSCLRVTITVTGTVFITGGVTGASRYLGRDYCFISRSMSYE